MRARAHKEKCQDLAKVLQLLNVKLIRLTLRTSSNTTLYLCDMAISERLLVAGF